MRKAVAKIAKQYSGSTFDVPEYLDVVWSDKQPAYLQALPSGPLRINWILPEVSAGQGGFVNIFRTIKQLEDWGHQNRVYILGRPLRSASAIQQLICERYFRIHAQVEEFSGEMRDSDALIATFWPTAYAARSVGNTARKFYFVQDLEHMFYPPGSLYELARQTYQFGFRGITAGAWIGDILRREFSMECSSFGFSYDRNLYASTGPRLLPEGKRRLFFYARPETERRGFELGLLALSLVAKRMPNVELVLAGLGARSIDLPFPASCLGVLPLSQLGSLYRSCDVALVLSHTNLSLLPLELMACGCAVVSNQGPNVEWLLTRETAHLAKADPKSLADGIIDLFHSDTLRRRQILAGLALAETTSWTKELRAIESALLAARENVFELTSHA
jgi:glycosyltransferase involved in cell wall biosynthesis